MAMVIGSMLLWAAISDSASGQTDSAETGTDSTEVYETAHYPVLQLPQTLWTWLVYPIGQTTIYAEHEKLPKKVREWFTNEEQTFGIFPHVQLGGETSTAGGGQLFLFTRSHQLNAAYMPRDADRHSGSLQYTDFAGATTYWDVEADYLKTNDEGSTANGSVEDRLGALFAVERADILATVGWRSNDGPLHLYNKGFSVEGRVGWGS